MTDLERQIRSLRCWFIGLAVAVCVAIGLLAVKVNALAAPVSPAPVLPGPPSAGAGENPPRVDVRPRHIRRVSRSETRRPLRRASRFHTGSHTSRPTPPPQTGGQVLDVTAYCWTGNPTASGVWPEVGMAAGNDWPFGTRLQVEGIGVVTVTDRYGSGTQLDLYMGRGTNCEERAAEFGRRQLHVEVLP